MRFVAKQRFADVTARKMRPIADLIRGKSADEAMEALRFLPNRGARLIEAVLKSAVGNAEPPLSTSRSSVARPIVSRCC